MTTFSGSRPQQNTAVAQQRNQAQAQPDTPLPQARRRELMRLERQLIPFLNSIRAELGKRPVIVPKE